MNIFINIYIRVSVWLLYFLITAVNRTLRLKITGEENYYRLKKEGKNIVFVFWHGATFIPIFHYKNKMACILTAPGLRGNILTKVAQKLGYQVVRLARSTEHNKGAKRMQELLTMVKSGFDSNIAVDGPTGPAFVAKPGAVFLSKQTGNPILPVASACNKKITLNTRWDKYFIPLPFSRASIVLGEPIYMKSGLSDVSEIKHECENISKTIKYLTVKAEEAVK